MSDNLPQAFPGFFGTGFPALFDEWRGMPNRFHGLVPGLPSLGIRGTEPWYPAYPAVVLGVPCGGISSIKPWNAGYPLQVPGASRLDVGVKAAMSPVVLFGVAVEYRFFLPPVSQAYLPDVLLLRRCESFLLVSVAIVSGVVEAAFQFGVDGFGDAGGHVNV